MAQAMPVGPAPMTSRSILSMEVSASAVAFLASSLMPLILLNCAPALPEDEIEVGCAVRQLDIADVCRLLRSEEPPRLRRFADVVACIVQIAKADPAALLFRVAFNRFCSFVVCSPSGDSKTWDKEASHIRSKLGSCHCCVCRFSAIGLLRDGAGNIVGE